MRRALEAVWIVFLTASMCAAQSATREFEQEHERGLKRNPPGIQLTIATKNGKSEFRASDRMSLILRFTASSRGAYELPGFNIQKGIDELVVQPPYPLHFMKMALISADCLHGCQGKRTTVGVGAIPVERSDGLVVEYLVRGYYTADIPEPGAAPLPPGQYAIYLQTKRVREKLPENGLRTREREFIVTSENILHFTLLPNEAQPRSAAPRER